MRYRYHNLAYIRSGAAHGEQCDPVKRDGKCIVSKGKQVVVFEDGTRAVVVRRCLRVISSAGMQPRPRSEVEAWLREKAERYDPGHTTKKLVDQWVESEMELREKGGLICNERR